MSLGTLTVNTGGGRYILIIVVCARVQSPSLPPSREMAGEEEGDNNYNQHWRAGSRLELSQWAQSNCIAKRRQFFLS